MKRVGLGTCLAVIGLGLIGGCVSEGGVAGTGGLGGAGGRGSGGAGGLGGGAGSVSGKLGWCAAESVAVAETGAKEINMAADARGNVVVVWRESSGSRNVWSNRWTPNDGWGTAERIQSEDAPTFRPRVAADSSGNVVAVWEQSDCMSSYDIFSRRWTPTEGWGAAERIDSEDGEALYPEVAIDPRGNVVVVWMQANGVGVRSTRSNRWSEDAGWGTAERIQLSDSYAYDAQVAVDPDGNAIATWRERDSENNYELWLNRWTPNEGWGAPEGVATTEPVGQYQMAVDPRGHVLAVWSGGSGGGFDRGLWSARWAGAWEPAERVVDDRRTRDPKVAFDRNGNAMATWMYWAGADTGGARIWAARWVPSWGWSGIKQLHDSVGQCNEGGFCTDGWSWDPQVAVDPDGNAFVVWKEAEEDTERQYINIWSRRWTPDAEWGDAERIEQKDRSAGPPQVGFDASGTGIAVWSQAGALRSSRFEHGCGNEGAGGAGGAGGVGGAGGDPCEGVVCPDTECRSGGACNHDDGTCTYAMAADDGTVCSEGECLAGGCGRLGAFACTEQGIRDAIAQGGGPHFFACDEAAPVVLSEEIVIDNDVVLDGEGELVLKGIRSGAIAVEPERSVELRAIRAIAEGYGQSISNRGSLEVVNSTVEGVTNEEGTLTLTDTEVRRFGVYNSLGEATLLRTRISGRGRYDSAGAITNFGGTMNVTDSVISDSGSEWTQAGAIYNSHLFGGPTGFVDGVLVVENTTISGNLGRAAGAIYNNGATVTLINSTISNNTAERGPSIHSWTWRGGPLTLINSTVSGAAVLYECGSTSNGYAIGSEGMLTMTNSTLAANAFGGLDNRAEATVTNSVIDGGCFQFGDDASTSSGGYNIVGGSDGCGFDDPTDMVDVSSAELALGPLADNGGPTTTHALLPGSVAIDAIPAPMCAVTEDQRGEPRPAGGMCDIGSFEVQP